MSYTALTKPTQGDPTKKSLIDAIIDDIAYLNSVLGSLSSGSTIANGSFEVDTDSDGTPDNWTKTLYTGGSGTRVSAQNDSGTYSFKFVSPGGGGNGGGYLDSIFFEVTPNRRFNFTWQMYSTVANVRNNVDVRWYDSAQSYISTTALFDDSATNPTAWALRGKIATPPPTARYGVIRLTGCNSSVSTAGSTWFDDVQVSVGQTVLVAEFFAASGTWTCPAYVTRAKMKVWGGGGASNTNASGLKAGACGGGYGEDTFDVIPGEAYTVTVGAAGTVPAGTGGTTSVGSLISATGGSTSAGGTSSATINFTGQVPAAVTTFNGFGLGGGAYGGIAGQGADGPDATFTGGKAGTIGAVVIEY